MVPGFLRVRAGLGEPCTTAPGDGRDRRFLPAIAAVTELWCQGFSEPGAGSDLASLSTSARLDGEHWVLTGQKVWTSLAHIADWCFVLARTDPDSRRSAGLSMLLVPMRQPGVEVRPIRQLTGSSEFNEVFFDGARTDADLVLGQAGDGWRVARFLLGVERGTAVFGQLISYRREFDDLVAHAKRTGAANDPLLRDRLARAWLGLEVLRSYALATVAGGENPEADSTANPSVMKILWSRWHKSLGELAMEVRGAAAMVARAEPYELDGWQSLYLFSRADTTSTAVPTRIQLGIIAGRAAWPPAWPVVMIVPSPPHAGRRDLLAGKVVVPSRRRPGTGIGGAAARRLPGRGRCPGDQRRAR